MKHLYIINIIISLVITILLIFVIPSFIERYEIKFCGFTATGGENARTYIDLDSDGLSEMIDFGPRQTRQFYANISDINGKLITVWNLPGSYIKYSDIIYGDYDNNGYVEIYAVTQSGDSLFLNGFEVLNKAKHFISFSNKFIDVVKKSSGGFNDFSFYPGKLIDLNGDSKQEVLFSIHAGFSLIPRRIYAYDIVNDSLYKSPQSGNNIWTFLFFDINNDGKEEIMGTSSASGNFVDREFYEACKKSKDKDSLEVYNRFKFYENIPYWNSSAWLMCYNSNLEYLFNPIEFKYWMSVISVYPYRYKGINQLAVFYNYNGQLKIKPFIALYDVKGNISKKKYFEYKVGMDIFTSNSKSRNNFYLFNEKGFVYKLDSKLDTIETYNYSEILGNYSNLIGAFDIDKDGEEELLFFHVNQNKLIIFREDFTNPTILNDRIEGCSKLSIKYNGKENPQFSFRSGNKDYLLEYKRNDKYFFKYVYYLGIFIGLFLFITIIQWISAQKLRKDKQRLEKKVLERTLEIQKQKKEIEDQRDEIIDINEELNQQNEEIATQRDSLEELNIELHKLSIVASEINNAVIICDNKGNFEWVNRGFNSMYGLSLEEFTLKHGNTIFETSNNPELLQNVNEAVKQNKSITYNSYFKRSSDSLIWIHTTITPILDENGHLEKLIAITSDITKIKEAEEHIRAINHEISDSINYAKRIQGAILPSSVLLSKNFSDHFIYYKPRNVVSGDFYWFAEIENNMVIAVGDCTGHGVPGAFMSMLGISLLREIVQKEHIIEPSVILRKLRNEIINTLKQKNSENIQKDGMDISLFSIDIETLEMQWAGANIRCIICKDGILQVIKADNMPIGIHEKMGKFITHEVQLNRGDIIYLSTDGYYDQFGGPENKKLMFNRFKEILTNISSKSMDIQKDILHETIENWKNNREEKSDQTDDITVLGIKI